MKLPHYVEDTMLNRYRIQKTEEMSSMLGTDVNGLMAMSHCDRAVVLYYSRDEIKEMTLTDSVIEFDLEEVINRAKALSFRSGLGEVMFYLGDLLVATLGLTKLGVCKGVCIWDLECSFPDA